MDESLDKRSALKTKEEALLAFELGFFVGHLDQAGKKKEIKEAMRAFADKGAQREAFREALHLGKWVECMLGEVRAEDGGFGANLAEALREGQKEKGLEAPSLEESVDQLFAMGRSSLMKELIDWLVARMNDKELLRQWDQAKANEEGAGIAKVMIKKSHAPEKKKRSL